MATPLVGLDGAPWTINTPVVVTLTFRDAETMLPFNPAEVRRVELLDVDAVTVIEGVNATTFAGPGRRRATFAAVVSPGTRFIRTFYKREAADVEATDVEPFDVFDSSDIRVAGVMTLAEFRTEFLGALSGEPEARDILRDDEGNQLLSDAALAAAIRREAAYVASALDMPLVPTRFASRPDVPNADGVVLRYGVDYDEEVSASDWRLTSSTFAGGHIALGQSHVRAVTRARIVYGSTAIYEFPTRWCVLDKRSGSMRLIIDRGSLSNLATAVETLANLSSLHAAIGYLRFMPAYWAIDFVAGPIDVPLEARAAIGWRAAGQVLAMAAVKANKAAVTSQSESVDGLSRSQSVADSQPGGRFSRLLQLPLIQEWMSEDRLMALARRVRPGVRVF